MTPILPRRPDWWDHASCAGVGPRFFFPEKDVDGGTAAASDAKWWCRACPVKSECLEHALTNNEKEGVWGGLSSLERRALRRVRALEAQEDVA